MVSPVYQTNICPDQRGPGMLGRRLWTRSRLAQHRLPVSGRKQGLLGAMVPSRWKRSPQTLSIQEQKQEHSLIFRRKGSHACDKPYQSIGVALLERRGHLILSSDWVQCSCVPCET